MTRNKVVEYLQAEPNEAAPFLDVFKSCTKTFYSIIYAGVILEATWSPFNNKWWTFGSLPTTPAEWERLNHAISTMSTNHIVMLRD